MISKNRIVRQITKMRFKSLIALVDKRSDQSRISSSEKKLPLVEIDVCEVTLHVQHSPFLSERKLEIRYFYKNNIYYEK